MSNDPQLNALASMGKAFLGQYRQVAASQTAFVLGATGAIGDVVSALIITPSNVAAGLVTLLDNAIAIPIFAGGTLADLTPIIIPLNMVSVSGAWKVTTGAAVTVIAIGSFT